MDHSALMLSEQTAQKHLLSETKVYVPLDRKYKSWGKKLLRKEELLSLLSRT